MHFPVSLRCSVLLLAVFAVPQRSAATASLLSQSAACFGACEFAPNQSGPGASTNILRTFSDPPANPGSLTFQNSAAMTVTNYNRFGASVSSTEELQDYPSGTPGLYGPNGEAIARAVLSDAVNVSGGSGIGKLRMSWHVEGSVDVGWSESGPLSDIDYAQVALAFGCVALASGSPSGSNCSAPQLTWNAPATVDQIVNVDVPIRFDTSVQYQLTIALSSSAGTGPYVADGLISLQARALGGFGSTGTLVDVQVLDASGNPLAFSSITSESGFRYDLVSVPEPSALCLVGSGALGLLAVRRRRRA